VTTVVKIGGILLQDPGKAALALSRTIRGPSVVVHGGGVQITRMLERLEVKSQFIDGLRVTDEKTLKIVSLALLGDVHTHLVQSMQDAGLAAIGVFGALRATKMRGPWGLVGADLGIADDALLALLAKAKIPVIATLANGVGTLLNVNGDDTAAALAAQLHADRLIFMTDVAGVKNETGAVLDEVKDIDLLLDAPFVSGGMRPKLRAVKSALSGGVRLVRVGKTLFGGTE
jgi:acetylglutamate kinase